MTILFYVSYHRSIKAIVFVMWYFYITYDYNLVFLIKDTILNSYISPTTFLRVSKLKKRKHLICCSLFHTKVFVIFKGILDPFSIFHRSSIFLKQHTTNIVREVYYHKRQHIDMCRCVVVIIWCNNSTAYFCVTQKVEFIEMHYS